LDQQESIQKKAQVKGSIGKQKTKSKKGKKEKKGFFIIFNNPKIVKPLKYIFNYLKKNLYQ